MSKRYNSDTYLNYQELMKYYKLRPIEYINMIEGDFNIKLTLSQKILLYLYYIGISKTSSQKR